jgi:hypothetical protein
MCFIDCVIKNKLDVNFELVEKSGHELFELLDLV